MDAHKVSSGNTSDGSEYISQSCRASYYGPALHEVVDYFELTPGPQYEVVDTTATLHNGVKMPLIGLVCPFISSLSLHRVPFFIGSHGR